MITPQGLSKIAQYIDGILSHAVIHSGSTQVQTGFYWKQVEDDSVEIWVQVPDELQNVDKFQIIDQNGDVFIERSKLLTRRPGRALVEVFNLQVKGVTD